MARRVCQYVGCDASPCVVRLKRSLGARQDGSPNTVNPFCSRHLREWSVLQASMQALKTSPMNRERIRAEIKLRQEEVSNFFPLGSKIREDDGHKMRKSRLFEFLEEVPSHRRRSRLFVKHRDIQAPRTQVCELEPDDEEPLFEVVSPPVRWCSKTYTTASLRAADAVASLTHLDEVYPTIDPLSFHELTPFYENEEVNAYHLFRLYLLYRLCVIRWRECLGGATEHKDAEFDRCTAELAFTNVSNTWASSDDDVERDMVLPPGAGPAAVDFFQLVGFGSNP